MKEEQCLSQRKIDTGKDNQFSGADLNNLEIKRKSSEFNTKTSKSIILTTTNNSIEKSGAYKQIVSSIDHGKLFCLLSESFVTLIVARRTL